MIKNNGILYIATGNNYLNEAIRSAESAKTHMPDIPIAIFTDCQNAIKDTNLFTYIKTFENSKNSFFDKISKIKETPFSKTLFVDSDTYFIQSVEDVYTLLDKYDIVYCHAPHRNSLFNNIYSQQIPDCFPEANTGVIGFNKSKEVDKLYDDWASIYSLQINDLNPPKHDQPAFREALYNSKLKTCVLPCEYNLRTPMPIFKGAGIYPKILHGRGESLEEAIKFFIPPNANFLLWRHKKSIFFLNRFLIKLTNR